MKGILKDVRLIDKAKNCGVDAVKLQTFDLILFYERDKKRLIQLKKFSLTKKSYES